MTEIEIIKKELETLKEEFNKLRSSTTIPYDIGVAFKERVSGVQLAVSTKNLDSEDQSVDEGGAATYSVLGDPDGFLEITLGPTTYYLPYY